jgi:hypothetical protein
MCLSAEAFAAPECVLSARACAAPECVLSAEACAAPECVLSAEACAAPECVLFARAFAAPDCVLSAGVCVQNSNIFACVHIKQKFKKHNIFFALTCFLHHEFKLTFSTQNLF